MSLSNIPPNFLTLLASLLGIKLANQLDLNEQNSIGNFLQEFGQAILTVSAQQQLQQSQEDEEQLSQQIELLRRQIDLLEIQLKKNR